MSKPTRNRGVVLDQTKVQHFASKIGIGSLAQLQINYYHHHRIPSEISDYTSDKAWNGKKMDRSKATMLAQSIGLDTYAPLQQSEHTQSSWAKLISNQSLRQSFLQFVRHDQATDLELVRFQPEEKKGLDRIPIDTKWHLELTGSPSDEVFILIRSDNRFVQIAPVDHDNYENKFKIRRLRYPASGSLNFSTEDGTGWRQIIALRANQIPCELRDDASGYELNIDQLDQIARKYLNQNGVALDCYEFILE